MEEEKLIEAFERIAKAMERIADRFELLGTSSQSYPDLND